jgi:hypothetical protein
MDTASQMDPKLYREVVRKRVEVWDTVIAAFTTGWDRVFQPRWTPENRVIMDDVLADLAYGRE